MANIDAERLVQARKRCGYSQKFVAISIGVAPSVVSRWESGIKNPSRDSVAKLSDLYHVSADFLMGRSDLDGDEISSVTPYSQEEVRLIYDYRLLSRSNKDSIQKNILFLLSMQNEEKEPSKTTTA